MPQFGLSYPECRLWAFAGSPLRALAYGCKNGRGEFSSIRVRVKTVLVLSLVTWAPYVAAQNTAPNAPAGAPVAATSQEGAKPPIQPNARVATDVDARACLEFPTNMQIIKCAEKYRSHRPTA